ncbi:MAG: cupin domain-containing protein [Burkholderiales bacterium]|nr:cupin domain-containing protein [Burkholderiales bacterium]
MLSTIRIAGLAGLAILTAAPAVVRADDAPALEWQFVPGLARPIERAIVSGDPAQPGPYVIRYRMPSGMKVAPMLTPNVRELEIVKGVYWAAGGASYNWKDMVEHKAGTILNYEAGQPYFGWARTAVVLEERGEGPNVMQYAHPDDDPRNRKGGNKGSD